MKRVLITGSGSFIGMSLERYLKDYPYHVDTLDMRGDDWQKADFSGYDVVFHVASIVHLKEKEDMKALYFRVNRDLAIQTAQKAKDAGVGQFIFMSSASVYGDGAPIGSTRCITAGTEPSPLTFYGHSKLQAEQGLFEMQSEAFRVVVLRPPMVYGPGCKGNYPTLSKMARKLPFFPVVDNQRSMIYIDHLSEFVRLMIENREQGLFHPQNSTYSNTTQLVEQIAAANGKKIRLVKGITGILKLLSGLTPMVNKAFGSLTYDMALSHYPQDYCRYTQEETVTFTEAAVTNR